ALGLLLSFSCGPARPQISTLSLHDALPISSVQPGRSRIPTAHNRLAARSACASSVAWMSSGWSGRTNAERVPKDDASTETLTARSEEHTSELQSPYDLVCRLLLEKKKKKRT